MQLLAVHLEECSGCRTCELICALHNQKENNPAKAALRVKGLFPSPGHYELGICDQCGECALVCPTEAIRRRDDGVYVINPEDCIDCLACVQVCPREAMFTHESMDTPIKCNSCGECVTYCPKQVLAMSVEGGN